MKAATRRVWPGLKHGTYLGNTGFYYGQGLKRRGRWWVPLAGKELPADLPKR
jgi:hypothetical protein